MPAGRSGSGAGIQAGEAYVRFRAYTDDLVQAMRITEGQLKAWGQRIQKLGRTMAAAGVAGAALFIKPIREAANVEQLLGRFDSVFGDFAQNAGRYADDLAKRINQSSLTLRDQLAQFNAYLKGIGFDPGQANKLSQQLVAWSNDWIAFDDTIVNGQEAIDLFLSALSGEVRPARRMGADLRVLSLDAEAAAKGLGGASEKLSEVQRVGLRIGILERALGRSGVIGQAEREVNTLAAVFRGIKGALRDFSVAVGFAVIKPFTSVSNKIKEFINQLTAIVRRSPEVIQTFGRISIAAIGLGAAMEVLGRSIALVQVGKFAASMQDLGGLLIKHPLATGVGAGIVLTLANLTDAFVRGGGGWSRFARVARDAGKDIASALEAISLALAQWDIDTAVKIATLSFTRALLQFETGMKGWEGLTQAFLTWVNQTVLALTALNNALSMTFSLLTLPGRTLGNISEAATNDSVEDYRQKVIDMIDAEIKKLTEQLTGGNQPTTSDARTALQKLLKLSSDNKPMEGLRKLSDRVDRRSFKERYNTAREMTERAFTMYGPFNPNVMRQVTRPFWLLRDAAEDAVDAVKEMIKPFQKFRWVDSFTDEVVKNIIGTQPEPLKFSAQTSFGAIGASFNALGVSSANDIQEKQLGTLVQIKDNTKQLVDHLNFNDNVPTNNE